MSGGPWSFLMDNDPKHTSKAVQKWMHNHGVTCLDFPPYSPDLNPIENLWNDMARRVEQVQAGTMEVLQEAVAQEWKSTSKGYLQTLVHSMPARCQAVIDAKGEHTTY
jgi:transposase